MGRFAGIASLLFVLAGCPQYGIVDDGTSVSYGQVHAGTILNPAKLPKEGVGYRIYAPWAQRGLAYGTEELVQLLIYLGGEIDREYPGTVLGVADLSHRRGGRSQWHRSHHTGRDVDLLFFAQDAEGQTRPLRRMRRFRADGTSGSGARTIYFDTERNWALVRTAIENPYADVQHIFLSDPLRQLLLDHALATGESSDLIERASYILRQPIGAAPHDDHIHLRVYCSADDRALGCVDQGSLRWMKKGHKYRRLDPQRHTAALAGSALVRRN